jgi:putative ABC transport system permease protein
VVGVSNIMLISVQERTREIGVRKAVGAPPASIVLMIVEEALAITIVSGYSGLVAGVGLLTLVQRVLPPTPFFKRPDVDLGVALGATFVLVICGALAGLFPALRAARINPIAALRVE